MRKVNAVIRPMVPGPSIDHCLLEQYKDQISGFKMELIDISRSIATIEDAKELADEKSWISNAIISIGLRISKVLSSTIKAPTMPFRGGIRLPKISVPLLDGKIPQ